MSRQLYKPWGETCYASGELPTSFGFTGQRSEMGTLGLYFYKARWYVPATGRFTQRDPFPGWVIWPDTLNAYPYVLNNPVNWTDPSGEFGFIPLLAAGLLGGFIGGVGYYTLETFMKADVCLGVQWDLLDALKGGMLGAGIGALLGSGLYGGWWAGMQLGWWGGGAATTATTAVLNATGGDLSDEVKAATQTAQQTLPTVARNLGKTGETLAGIVKNTTRIPSLTETAAYRVPDQLNRSQNLLSEVKNVAYQSYTSQIKDHLLYAQQQGLKFELIVRQNTEFSKPLQALIEAGKIFPQRNLPPH